MNREIGNERTVVRVVSVSVVGDTVYTNTIIHNGIIIQRNL